MTSIGFIGLGNMGAPMVANLLKKGHGVTVFDIVPASIETAVGIGAVAGRSAAATVADVDIVVSMLPASVHVEGLYLGEAGLLTAIDPASLVIDCSTISSASTQMVSTAAAERGITMLDAPVSGGVGGAVAGTLTFIVGGAVDAFARAEPVLKDMGKNVLHAGGAGAGQTAKICNNMLLSVLMAGTAEALQMGVDNSLDPSVLSNIMRVSSGGNWALEVYNPYPGVMDNVPASNDYSGGFLVDLMVKDLGLATETALASGSLTPMGSLARSLYLQQQRRGRGRIDFSSIQQLYSEPAD
jgi:3-hydroxyisobutyrate dehydrogenase